MTRTSKQFFTFLLLVISLVAYAKQSTLNNGNLVMQNMPAIPQQIKAELNRYQNIRSASFVEWAEDDESLYISTRFGDVSQLHRVSQAGGTRYQMTFFDEPIGAVSKQPGGAELSFTMDAGGSEFAQIFVLDPSTGESRMISDGESRNGQVVWNNAGTAMAFQSTRRNGAANDLWIIEPDNPETADMILPSPDGSWWGVTDFSADDSQVLVANYISANQSGVYLLNLANKKLTPLVKTDDSKSTNLPIAFDDLNNGFFYITDQYSEFSQLAWQSLDKPSAKPTIITADISWDIDNMVLSNDGRRAAFSSNENGRSELYLMDVKKQTYTKITGMPLGVFGGYDFNQSGDKLAITINTAQTPSDVYVIELEKDLLKSSALTRWTYSEVGGLNTNQFVVPEVISYPTFDQVDGKARQIPAFVYRPKTAGPHPVVISIHGGPEGQARPWFSSTYQMWVDELGVAVVVPNVRGSDGYGKSYLQMDNGFKREDSVKDIGALLDWVAQQNDLDQDRVAVYGGSYGGYMVLASSVHYSDRLKAAVNIVGISNFVTFLENTQDYRRDLRRVEYGDERIPEMREFLNNISPLNNVDKINVPMFVVQGQNDPRVPVTEADQIVAALEEKQQIVWYMNALNEGHGYRKKENRDVYQQAVILFLQKYLIPKEG
ncbi:alpha/beta fold hydrolase [Marinicella sp. S1101]|uniref:S9 family peptidase n=1 Tax=Marinicella marina TaxID=2996016 RepID=UPI002260CE64|nr:alpha/beta fold hydrolase [Marinicella marina]MCX7552366.1 alpha/beta fold hydrolase [Marinicella marina]MDJ1139241.1 alpha/beta fold hydrolase [Marinicella marina]